MTGRFSVAVLVSRLLIAGFAGAILIQFARPARTNPLTDPEGPGKVIR